jgi:acetyl-CoA acetyltransferase
MTHVYIRDSIRTPFGRYGGALSPVRADDLGAIPIRALVARNPKVGWASVTAAVSSSAARTDAERMRTGMPHKTYALGVRHAVGQPQGSAPPPKSGQAL